MRVAMIALSGMALCFATKAEAGDEPNYRPNECSPKCFNRVKKRELRKAHQRKRARLRREWRHWTGQYIPRCTWHGESGPGPEFARWRYTVINTSGSGARGKYQMMPGTYAAFAKYGDWSRLDQEIAAHRLYWAQGTSPWSAC